jgi:hypothetical protein
MSFSGFLTQLSPLENLKIMSSSGSVAGGLIAPVVALNLWTFVMEIWLYATRIPAIQALDKPIKSDATKAEFDALIPAHVRWKADNYNHLLEQPVQLCVALHELYLDIMLMVYFLVVFLPSSSYAIALALAIMGADNKANVAIAWTYVGLRVVHSLVQAIWNKIMLRFSIFILSSFVLLALTLRSAVALKDYTP